MIRPERLSAGTEPAGDGAACPVSSARHLPRFELRLSSTWLSHRVLVANVDTDDDLPPIRAGEPITLRWAPEGRTCCVDARPSSGPPPPMSTRCRPRWTAQARRRAAAAAGGEPPPEPVRAPGADRRRRSGGRGVVVGGVLAVTGSGGSAGDGDSGEGRRQRRGRVRRRRHEVRILNWQAYIDPDGGRQRRDARTVHRGDGDRGQLQRGLQQQQRGLQPHPRARPRHRRGHRLRHHLPHQLDGCTCSSGSAGPIRCRSNASPTGSTSRTGS